MSGTTALVFARCIGFILRAPGFSHPGVPVMVRLALAFVLAFALAPLAHAPAGAVHVSFVLALVTEVLIGAAIGLAASAIYEGAAAGGKLLDTYVGIQALNPSADVTAGSGFGQLWGVVFVAAFFFFDGYRWLVGAFAGTVSSLPPGSVLGGGDLQALAIAIPAVVLRAAVLVAGPALVIGLVAQIAIGAIARVIPRFANFTLTFPVVFGLVLLVTLAAVPAILLAGRDMIAHPLPPLPFLNK